MKLIIAGGRGFKDAALMEKEVKALINYYAHDEEHIEVVSGACKSGADRLGESLAKAYGWSIRRFPADWEKGKSSGPIRNSEMAAYATHCICFWDGNSKGTADMIKKAELIGLPTHIVRY